MKKYFDLGSLTLGNSGGVIGAESTLEVLSEQDIDLVSGARDEEYYADSSNNRCNNHSSCGGSTNSVSCSNGGCDGSVNGGSCKIVIVI